MNYVGLFEGISGFGLAFKRAGARIMAVCERSSNRYSDNNRRRFNCSQFFGCYYSAMCKPVTVRAKNDSIFKSVLASVALENYVMSIAGRLLPAASHTNIRIHSPHCHVPRAFVGVFDAFADDIRLALIPRHFGTASVKRLYRCANLSLAFVLVLVAANVFPGSPTRICAVSFITAAASAIYDFHIPHLLENIITQFSRNSGTILP